MRGSTPSKRTSHIIDLTKVGTEQATMDSFSTHVPLHDSRSHIHRTQLLRSSQPRSPRLFDKASAFIIDAGASPRRPLKEQHSFPAGSTRDNRSNFINQSCSYSRASSASRASSNSLDKRYAKENHISSNFADSRMTLDDSSSHSKSCSWAERTNLSCSKSRISTRSRSSSRSRLRKDLHLERTVRNTILEAVEAEERISISSAPKNDMMESTVYSTDDILKDLGRANAILVTEIKSSAPRSSTSEDHHKNIVFPSPFVLRPSASLSSSERSLSSPQRKDRDMFHRKQIDLLPPIYSQGLDDDEDDASWQRSRTAEPTWANLGENGMANKRSLTKNEFKKTSSSPRQQGETFDEWGFEEPVFSTTNGSITSSSKSSSIARPEDLTRTKLESKLSSDSGRWTMFDWNPFNHGKETDDCSHRSPSSVVDCSVHSKYPFAGEAAWRRRLKNRGVHLYFDE